MAVGERLREVAAAEPLPSEVRGVGLLAAVDIRGNRSSARSVLEALVRQRVLAGLTGPDGRVLEIRPPLSWTNRHADQFVTALRRCVSDLR